LRGASGLDDVFLVSLLKDSLNKQETILMLR